MNLKVACSIPPFALALFVFVGCWRESGTRTITEHITEVPTIIGTGLITNANGGDFMSYGFYALAEPLGSSEKDFLLVLRNTGAKYVDLNSTTIDACEIQDVKGKKPRLILRSHPMGVANQESTSLQFAVNDYTNLLYPLAFSFKANFHIPVYLCITNIYLQDK